MTRAWLDKTPADVAAMFDGVARRYDLTNTVLAAGQDRRWRHAVTRALQLRPGLAVLDLAAGTATSSLPLAWAGARVVSADFSPGMLATARHRLGAAARRHGAGSVALLAADGLALPFGDDTFDRVTISFGLRNVADPAACLGELLRVTRPGGQVVVCEFSHPTVAPLRVVYLNYLMRALPAIAHGIATNPDAYAYLAASIRAWPDQAGLGSWLQEAGWTDVAWRNLSGGIVALHRGRKGEAVGGRAAQAAAGGSRS